MNISARWLLIVLGAIAGILVFIHLWLYWMAIYVYPDQQLFIGAIDRFDLDNEESVPTWYAQFLLFFAGLIALFISAANGIKRSARKYWVFIALLLFLMSIDEGATFHETLGVWIGQQLNLYIPLGFAELRDWVVVAIAVVAIVGAILWRFTKTLPSRTKWLLFAGALVFVSGALGIETLHHTTFNFEYGSYAHRVSNAAEEGLEMAGAVIAVYALADYAKRNVKAQRVKFT